MMSDWFTAANSIIGGIAFLAIVYAVGTKKLRVGYEADEQNDLYKGLWEEEKKSREKAELANDQLISDLRSSIASLSDTSKALQNANDLLTKLVHERGIVDRRRPQTGE